MQTLYIVKTDHELTFEQVRDFAKYCTSESVGWYVDSPGRGIYNLVYPIVFGPTPEEAEAGQSWVRCDAGYQAETHCCRIAGPRPGSMQGAMSEDLARFQQCIAQIPHPKRSQPLVSCKEPHRAELLVKGIEMDAADYPSTAELDSTGRSLCAELVAEREDVDNLVLTPLWEPEEDWQGRMLSGGCWIHSRSGLLPAA